MAEQELENEENEKNIELICSARQGYEYKMKLCLKYYPFDRVWVGYRSADKNRRPRMYVIKASHQPDDDKEK